MSLKISSKLSMVQLKLGALKTSEVLHRPALMEVNYSLFAALTPLP
uniref:Uncharacterized protein n=1 Tax=Anguilla anguilla TaxID=7936 RepID=A0A0E9PQX7_ANGAN